MRSSSTKGDIRTFVERKICHLDQGKEKFCDILTERANGTFLWVALVIPRLNSMQTQQKIVDGDSTFLDKLLPTGLDAMYNRVLLNILEHQYQRGTVEILRCLTVSLRPLTRMEVCSMTALDQSIVNDALQAFQQLLSTTGKGSADKVNLIHLSLRQHLVCNSSSLLPVEVCWSVGPRLSVILNWLCEKSFQLWLFDLILLVNMSICFQGFLFQHLGLTLGFISFIGLYYYSVRPNSSLLIGLLIKGFELLINKIIMVIFGIHEPQVHHAMFQRCIALMDDGENGIKKDICGINDPGPLENKAALQAKCSRL